MSRSASQEFGHYSNLAWICRSAATSTRIAHYLASRRQRPIQRAFSTTKAACSGDMSPWNVSTLTAVSSDTEPTLVVNLGTAKYVFNAGEGMGRAWLESHHTFRRTKGLFLTGVGFQRCGGIAGMFSRFPPQARRCKSLSAPFAELPCPYVDLLYRGYRANTTIGQGS